MAQTETSPNETPEVAESPPAAPPEAYEEVPDAAVLDRTTSDGENRGVDDSATTPNASKPSDTADTIPGTDEDLKPALPEGMTLDEALTMAEQTPRPDVPDAIVDDRLLAFFLADQFEYRVDGKSPPDVLGWEANAWVGGDFNRIWFKPEGEATFHSPGSIESETDVLYSRLVLPFWSAQVGAQYANDWSSEEGYSDRWSGVVAFQGLFPGKFEVDASLYISEAADVTAVLELEYDWRLTQRLVAQPRTELSFAFQNIPDRNLGAGLTDVIAGLRFRYEFQREFAPYLGMRYEGTTFGTVRRTRAEGEEVWRLFGVVGMRFAFL